MWQLNLNPGKFGAADPVPKSYQIEPNEGYINSVTEGNCRINSYKDDNEFRKMAITEMSTGHRTLSTTLSQNGAFERARDWR
jgi:hypothetical protein